MYSYIFLNSGILGSHFIKAHLASTVVRVCLSGYHYHIKTTWIFFIKMSRVCEKTKATRLPSLGSSAIKIQMGSHETASLK